jgi:hypothetical protein
MQEMAETMGKLAEEINQGTGPEDVRQIGERLRNAAGALAMAAVRELTGELRQHALELCAATAKFCDTLEDSD